MDRYAVIEGRKVVNVVVWDGSIPLDAGLTLVRSDEAGPGWTYQGGGFSPPPAPPVDTPTDLPDDALRNALRNFPANGTPKQLADLLAGSGGVRVPGRPA